MPEKRRLSLSFSLAQREQRDAWERLSAVAPGQRMEAVCRMIGHPRHARYFYGRRSGAPETPCFGHKRPVPARDPR